MSNEVGVLPLGSGVSGEGGALVPVGGGALVQQTKGRKLMGLAGDVLLYGSLGAGVSGLRKSGHDTAANVTGVAMSTVGTGLFLFSSNEKVAHAGRMMVFTSAMEVAINVGGDMIASALNPHTVSDLTGQQAGQQTLSGDQIRNAGRVVEQAQPAQQQAQETVEVRAQQREAA